MVNAGRTERPMLGIALMLAFTTLAATADAITKSFTEIYPVPQLLWIRFLGQTGALLLLVPWVGWRGLVVSHRPSAQLARGMLLTTSAALFVFALSMLPFSTAKVLAFTSPLLVALLSLPLLGERVGWARAAAIAVGFAGVVVIIRPDHGSMEWAMLLPLGTATTYALYQLMTRQIATHDGPLPSLFYVSIVGLGMTSLAVPFFWTSVSPGHLAFLLVHGAAVGFGHFLQIRALSMASASLLAPFGYASLIWAVTFGYLAFGEIMDWGIIVGGTAIAGCGIYLFRGASARRERT